MASEFRYAAYPAAPVYDADGNQIHHLLLGDWVKLTGPLQAGKQPVHVRGTDALMLEQDLQTERLLEIVFVDVGQGDGALIVTPADERLLVDAGVASNLYRYLRWRFHFQGGVRKFDAAIITHPDSDHYQGFAAVMREPNIRFKRVYHNGIMEQYGKPSDPRSRMGGQVHRRHDRTVGRPPMGVPAPPALAPADRSLRPSCLAAAWFGPPPEGTGAAS